MQCIVTPGHLSNNSGMFNPGVSPHISEFSTHTSNHIYYIFPCVPTFIFVHLLYFSVLSYFSVSSHFISPLSQFPVSTPTIYGQSRPLLLVLQPKFKARDPFIQCNPNIQNVDSSPSKGWETPCKTNIQMAGSAPLLGDRSYHTLVILSVWYSRTNCQT